MEKYRIQWVGSSCGQHGPYTFYKGFKFYKNSRWRILSLGEFFFVKCSEHDPLCIAELQLLWEDKGTEGIMLSSTRLYFLPEHTPEGRNQFHGKDEVIAVNGKAIMSIEDLLDWVCMEDVRWIDGCPTICERDNTTTPTSVKEENSTATSSSVSSPSPAPPATRNSQIRRTTHNQSSSTLETFALNSGLKFKDINHAKKLIGCENKDEQKIIIMSYPNYCRNEANLKRIQNCGNKWLNNPLLHALGLAAIPHPNTKILFCRDEFDHPTLEDDDRLCEYSAPNLKGRPRKRKISVKSDDNDRWKGDKSPKHHKCKDKEKHHLLNSKHSRRKETKRSRVRSNGGDSSSQVVDTLAALKAEFKRGKVTSEELFLTHLYKFMKDQDTPIDRIPNLGFKQIDLFSFFEVGHSMGGYDVITSRKQWKVVYDKLGGNPGSTSAATCTRRHYERLLLPFEQFLMSPDEPEPASSQILSHKREHKHRKKDKAKKKSRTKHVREQLAELEASRQAQRRAQEQEAQRLQALAAQEAAMKSEAMASQTTVTTADTSAVQGDQDLKPLIGITGSPLVGMPTMVTTPHSTLPSMVTLPTLAGNHLLGLKGPVILAIPQMPVIAATSVPKSKPESPTIAQQPLDQKPLMISTVLDKVGGGMSLMQQRDCADMKNENLSSRTERVHHTVNDLICKEEKDVGRLRGRENPVSSVSAPALPPQSAVANGGNTVVQENVVSRPSVIQHTHQAKVKSEPGVPSGLIRPPLGHVSAIHSNDMILRNMSKEQIAAEQARYQKTVAEMSLLTTPRFMAPYMAFLPPAPFLLRPPFDPSLNPANAAKSPNVTVNKLSEQELSGVKGDPVVPDVSPKPSPVSVVQPVRSKVNPVKYEPVPVQDEPCDLSLPKKRHRDVEDIAELPKEKRREPVIGNTIMHMSTPIMRESPVHKLRTSDKKLHKHFSHVHSRDRHHVSMPMSLSSSSSSPSPSSMKVKMTPNPRGSITQGIINPARSQSYAIPSQKDQLESSKSPSMPCTKPSTADLASPPPRFPLDFTGLGLPLPVDGSGSGKPLPPLGDLNPASLMTRFPMLPYYPFLPRPPFLPPGAPFLRAGLPPGLPVSQAGDVLQRGLLFRPPLGFPPPVPYSTAQLCRENQPAPVYRS